MTARTAPSPALEGNDIRSANYLPATPDVAQEPQKPATTLRQTILQALDWQGLEAVLAQIPTLVKAGQIDQEQALGLAAIAAQEAQVLPEQAEEEWLSGLFRRGPVHRVKSRLLGEEVLFAADGAEIPAGCRLVVYRQCELARLVSVSPAQLRAVHYVKRALDGEIVEEEEAGPTARGG